MGVKKLKLNSSACLASKNVQRKDGALNKPMYNAISKRSFSIVLIYSKD